MAHRSRSNEEQGAAAVELALVLPILILLLGGIVDFGFAFNTQISLTHAAREGARVEAIGTGDGGPTAAAAFQAPAATLSGTTVRACPHPDGAQVTISADSRVFFGSILPIVGNTIPLEGQAVMRCGG